MFLTRDPEEGFTLIELVIVVSLLSILSTIAMPTFICFQRKAKATAALAAVRQIQTECAINKADKSSSGTFLSRNLNSYLIQSDGMNSCTGDPGTGLISAIPNDTDILPVFIFATKSNELSYRFKGQNGTNLSDCLRSICLQSSDAELSLFNSNFKNAVASGKTLEDKFYRRGDTIYVIVSGDTWESAQENAEYLGGNLASINNQEENDWLVNELFGNDKASSKLTDKGEAIWLGQKLNDSGKYESVSGEEELFNNWGPGEYSDGLSKGEKYTILNLYDNSARDPGMINTVANRQFNTQELRERGGTHIFYGLAEIKLNQDLDVDDSELDEQD